MKLILTAEQQELAASLQRFLADLSPMARVREIAESSQGYDAELWSRMVGELGLTALPIPESYGGAGYGLTEACVVLETLGAALTPTPYLPTLLAIEALKSLEVPVAKEYLPSLASGTIATLYLPALGASLPTASPSASGYVLTGEAPRVLHAADADLTLIPAALPSSSPSEAAPSGLAEIGLFALTGPAALTPLTTLDLTRPRATITLASTPARLLGAVDLDHLRNLAYVALAADQLGGIRHCLSAIVEYAKLRVQFGRFIGSFQAVKHKLADMHCTLEQAESLTRHATWAADESPADLPTAAALAQCFLGPAYYQVAKDHLLLHGGIGFTWEHDAHLYYKRAKDSHLFFGPPHTPRHSLATALNL